MSEKFHAIIEQAERVKSATAAIGIANTELKTALLAHIESGLERSAAAILAENQRDLAAGKEAGLSEALLDRLALSETRIQEMIAGSATVRALVDPIGEQLSAWELENKLHIEKRRVPLGAIGIIYEARPNVTVDASVLCLKAGNTVLLRGSGSAIHSNRALVAVIQTALQEVGLPESCVELVQDTSRESVATVLGLSRQLDVLIPRGGAGLINHVVENARVPVLETGAGNCHVYIEQSADFEMARSIVLNAKTQRPSVCNAIETVLIDSNWGKENTVELLRSLVTANVEVRACPACCELLPELQAATAEDWDTEFLDYIIACRIVDGVDSAIEHINSHGTNHSEAIISSNPDAVEQFLNRVDAAAVYHNASTRFTDGFQFGFGAEIGISTQKLHARGPMGLSELTSYKYVLRGAGQIRS